MNKVLFGIIAIAIIGGGVLAFSNSTDDSSDSARSSSDTNVEQTEQNMSQDNDEIELASTGSGQVVAYSADALASSDTAQNLLFFHAAWCSICNSVERNLDASNIPDDLTIFKVDYDSTEGQELAEKYGIPIQYSMVQVSTNGDEITQWVNQHNDGISEINSNLQAI